MKADLFSSRPLRDALACAVLASASAGAWALPTFTFNPGAIGLGGTAVTADNLLLSDFSNVAFTSPTNFTETGFLSVSGFQLGGSNLSSATGLNSAYSLYFSFTGTGHQTLGNAGTNLQTTPTMGVLDSLNFTLFAAPGNTTFGFAGDTPTTSGNPALTLATGSLLGGFDFTVPASGGAGFSPGENAAVSFNVAAAEQAFFTSPNPFYNNAFAAFVNNSQTVTATASGFRINNGGGNLSFSATSITPVPEPETYALMLAGLGVIAFVARRQRRLRR